MGWLGWLSNKSKQLESKEPTFIIDQNGLDRVRLARPINSFFTSIFLFYINHMSNMITKTTNNRIGAM